MHTWGWKPLVLGGAFTPRSERCGMPIGANLVLERMVSNRGCLPNGLAPILPVIASLTVCVLELL